MAVQWAGRIDVDVDAGPARLVALASCSVPRCLAPVSPIVGSAARFVELRSDRLAPMPRKVTARFIEPMLLLRTDALPK